MKNHDSSLAFVVDWLKSFSGIISLVSSEMFNVIDSFVQIQCMHLVSPDQMLIAVRGNTNMINVYLVDGKYKCLHSLPFGENTQITSMTSNSEYLFVGLNEGVVRCIQKKQLKKAEKKRNDHQIVVGRYRILALAVVGFSHTPSPIIYIFICYYNNYT